MTLDAVLTLMIGCLLAGAAIFALGVLTGRRLRHVARATLTQPSRPPKRYAPFADLLASGCRCSGLAGCAARPSDAPELHATWCPVYRRSGTGVTEVIYDEFEGIPEQRPDHERGRT